MEVILLNGGNLRVISVRCLASFKPIRDLQIRCVKNMPVDSV